MPATEPRTLLALPRSVRGEPRELRLTVHRHGREPELRLGMFRRSDGGEWVRDGRSCFIRPGEVRTLMAALQAARDELGRAEAWPDDDRPVRASDVLFTPDRRTRTEDTDR